MIFILLTGVILSLDLISKYFANVYLAEQSFVCGDFLNITLSKNSALAFSVPFPYWGQIIFSVLLLVLLAFYLYQQKPLSRVLLCSGALIFGGALGNLIERLMFSEVSDFIDFSFWPSFNLADSFILIGALLLLLNSPKEILKK